MTQPAALDYGTDGPAALARPSAVIEVGATYRGSVQPGEVVYARRYADATRYDQMHANGQLSDRQHAAAVKLAGILGALPRTVGRYGAAPGGDEAEGLAEYRRVLRSLPAQQAWRIDAMLRGDHPGWRLGDVQAGLETLGREWGLD